VSTADYRGRRRHPRLALLPVVGVVALGGVIGSLLRYQAGLIWPTPVGAFPTTILLVNLLGCLVIGVFLTVVTEVWTPHRLVRPFFGTGVLGGFTTFSTYSLDVVTLVRVGQSARAIEYLFATAIGAMLAVTLGVLTTRRLVARRAG
jgi:CrcB protein